MGTYYYQPPLWENHTGTIAGGQVVARQSVENWRNCIKNGLGAETVNLNKALPSPRWVVSDIGRWGTGATIDKGYFFVVRDTTEGCEWCLSLGGLESDNNASDGPEWFGPTSTGRYDCVQSTRNIPSNGGGSTYHIGPMMGFSPDYATWSFADNGMGFDNTTTLTYTGGDFSTVGVVPSTKALVISDWMYDPAGGVAGELKWFQLGGTTPTPANTAGVYGMVICEEAASLSLFNINGSTPLIESYCCFSKRMFTPNEAGDTNVAGGIWFYITFSAAQWFTISTTAQGGIGWDSEDNFIYNYDLSFLNAYTKDNYLDDVGDLKWRLIACTSPDDDKGVLHKDVCREMGLDDRLDMTLVEFTDTVPMKCIGERIAVPWPTGVPMFPVWYDGFGHSDTISVA
jgi:hypothetical protein